MAKRIPFSVDATLLRELGERLVGKPHIALGELIKNSYDADANDVIIDFGEDYITVIDDGHGMSPRDFVRRWMRVGSHHKERAALSPRLHRPLTGSKGVGRLAVQFLARKFELSTVKSGSREVQASIDWDRAVTAKDLTRATALVSTFVPRTVFAAGSKHGTAIRLAKLNQSWSQEDVVSLAREIWTLQPPFASGRSSGEDAGAFAITVRSAEADYEKAFKDQLSAYLQIWHARLVGSLERGSDGAGNASVTIHFDDGY
jgi:hypothetical protein